MEIESQLKRAFQKGLNLTPDIDVEALEFAKNPAWDSIAHLQLISTLEEEFSILIGTQDMLSINNYPKAKEVVSKYLAKSSK